ncbi:unnamed protein product [Brassica napus]|uniref:(rape) hypothetical protein n=1 Tax=Brassica napus TaxID=3708 RepID=A0A816Q844_BRANA|nr:unnamed protein product [Brassica napus]
MYIIVVSVSKFLKMKTSDGRDLGHNCKDSPLETLILRDCSLEEDVSSGNGLACDGDERTLKPNFPVEKLKEERSNFELVA